MLVDGAGKHIVDMLTIDRSLSGIASASSILDTSNYTFFAISFGKDAAGYGQHAHRVVSPSSDFIIKAVSYRESTVSSYQSSATASALELTYKLLPASPSPLDKRLEFSSTAPSSNAHDLGQCLNSVRDINLSSSYNIIGCFPNATGTNFWIVSSASNATGTRICSGVLSSFFNTHNLMDPSGFLTFAPGDATTQNSLLAANTYTNGAIVSMAQTFPNPTVYFRLYSGDAGALALFGGVYHLGLWTLDIKEMLKQGYNPPYIYNALNNIRKYRLFSKKTFNRDLLFVKDNGTTAGFNSHFSNNGASTGTPITITWTIKFV